MRYRIGVIDILRRKRLPLPRVRSQWPFITKKKNIKSSLGKIESEKPSSKDINSDIKLNNVGSSSHGGVERTLTNPFSSTTFIVRYSNQGRGCKVPVYSQIWDSKCK